MPVCLNDSSYYNAKTRICDNCRHEDLVEGIWKEKKPIKDKIIEDIQKTIRNSEVKKHVIQQNDDKILLLKSKIEKYLCEVKAQIELLDTEANEKIAYNNKQENIVQALMIEGKTKEEFEIGIVEKMAKAHENLQIKKIELDEAQHETKAIKEKIDIKSKAQIFEFKDIKSKLCNICAHRTRPYDLNHNHQEISKNICNCISF
jgi:excinuclease UvrABC ATPase subunit